MNVKGIHLIGMALLCAGLASCQVDTKLEYAKGGGIEKDQVMPAAPQVERQGLAVSAGERALRAVVGSGPHVFSAEDRIYFRSEYLTPAIAEDGSVRLDVAKTASGDYRLLCFPKGSRYWYRPGNDNPFKDLVIPYSQFYRRTVESLALYPLLARYDGSGSGIEFTEVISAVGITLTGNARVASVHLQNNSTAEDLSVAMAGVAAYDPDKGFVLQEGVDFVNLNCTDGGRGVDISGGETFYLVLAPGSFPQGLTLTVTDMAHKGQRFDIPAFDLAAGQVTAFSFSYAPDEDLLFFEHFDNFVWGGHVKGNRAVASYAPDALSSPGTDRKGTEEAFTTVGVTTPGSYYIQENWNTVNGWTVGERPSVSREYVTSRNLADMTYLFRCQEYQGCLSVGSGDGNRGGFQPLKSFPVDDAYYGVQLDFDVCLRYGTEDNFYAQLNGSGITSSLIVDGKEVALEDNLDGNNTYSYTFQNICTIRRSDIPAPSSERYADGWHHVRMILTNLNDLSALGLWGYDSDSIRHGAFIDNVEIRYVPIRHPENRLRVMLYNIQNGMWADQGNNFDNFVSFVRKYDPDVCIFCEAQSFWPTDIASEKGYSSSNYHLFNRKRTETVSQPGTDVKAAENAEWRALASRFGHPYHAVSGYTDDFPQVITSKYPVKTIKRLTSGLAHGAGHFQVSVGGEAVNFVSMHMWPFKYAKSKWNADTTAQKASAALLEGYIDAKNEVVNILKATVSRTDCGDNWLLMGDTNSVSPIDGDYYDDISFDRWLSEQENWVLPHEAFRSGAYGRDLYDMLREGEGSLYTGTGRFMPTTASAIRMDIMYGSESMRRRVGSMSLVVRDNWSNITSSAVYDPESDSKHARVPSDHRPLLIEFDMAK